MISVLNKMKSFVSELYFLVRKITVFLIPINVKKGTFPVTPLIMLIE